MITEELIQEMIYWKAYYDRKALEILRIPPYMFGSEQIEENNEDSGNSGE